MASKPFLFFLGLAVLDVVTAKHVHFFRKDYIYFEEYDAFYKFHRDMPQVSWNSAFLACDEEGSKLFYPKSKDEWTVVKRLVEAMPKKSNSSKIFVGIHDDIDLGEMMTVDGRSTPSPILTEDQQNIPDRNCLLMDVETGSYIATTCEPPSDTDDIKNFVCKKTTDQFCPTVDREYSYVKDTKKCYKVNNRAKTWNGAMQTCFLEGGLLAVIESDHEANIVKNMISDRGIYFVGFRRASVIGNFFTVKGQTLFENAYHNFDSNEGYYNNVDNDENRVRDLCGAVHKKYSNDRLYTKAESCFSVLPFICEMEGSSDV